MKSKFWIMRPFNAVFWLCISLFIGILAIASILLRNADEKVRELVLVSACIFTCLSFFVYKYYLSIDSEYDVMTANMGGFNWWGELPLHLCNINMILIPIAVILRSRELMSFCFFIGPLGGFMALAMPVNGFDGYSIFLPRMLGFYGIHYMIIIEALAIVTFGFYQPSFSDLPRVIVTIMAVAFVIFLVNVFLRKSGLHTKANYFYLMETEGNPMLDIFHRLIPLPYLYMLPSLVILVIYVAVVIAIYSLICRIL